MKANRGQVVLVIGQIEGSHFKFAHKAANNHLHRGAIKFRKLPRPPRQPSRSLALFSPFPGVQQAQLNAADAGGRCEGPYCATVVAAGQSGMP